MISGVAFALHPSVADAYNLESQKWPFGDVVMYPQLGSNTVSLDDGATSWNQVAEYAMSDWNAVLYGVDFKVVRNSTSGISKGDGHNSMYWNSNVFGTSFGSNTLAVTSKLFKNGVISEADITFNNTKSWNSYRGNLWSNGTRDFKRVALHELGHVIGLDHPDDIGQSVSAIMNSLTSDLDHLVEDDIIGANTLYGPSSVNFYYAQYYYNLFNYNYYLKYAYYYYYIGYAYYYQYYEAGNLSSAYYYLYYYLAYYYYYYFMNQGSLKYASYYYNYYLGYAQYYAYWYLGDSAKANSALNTQFYYANYYFNYYSK